MTPTETTTILRQYREWLCDTPKSVRPLTRQINEAIDAAVEMIDRLEAAEKERDALRTELNEIRYGVAVAHDTIKTLRAKIAEMERQEPVAWMDQNGTLYNA